MYVCFIKLCFSFPTEDKVYLVLSESHTDNRVILIMRQGKMRVFIGSDLSFDVPVVNITIH